MHVSDKLVIFLHMVRFKYLPSLITFWEGGCRIDLMTCQGLYDLFWVTGLLLILGPAPVHYWTKSLLCPTQPRQDTIPEEVEPCAKWPPSLSASDMLAIPVLVSHFLIHEAI